MNVVIFGATGMVGQGVLRECLAAPQVESVLAVGRTATGAEHTKLSELVHTDLFDYSAVESELTGYDACFFCLGVSSAGMSEESYDRITYQLTIAAAETLARLNPAMTFIFVSGAGTDSSESGRIMWARIKGKAENAVMKLPFKASYMFRPAFINPMHGIKAKTRMFRVMYNIIGPLYPLWKLIFPSYVTTTEKVGLAMLRAASDGYEKQIVENRDINVLAE